MKILVVDDNQASAQTLGWMLEMMGHEYKLALNGVEALKAAPEYVPDLVLLDLGLPDINGYDVCRKLRAMPELSNVRIVAQTGWGEDKCGGKTQDAGFDRHLVKPIEIEVLQQVLQR